MLARLACTLFLIASASQAQAFFQEPLFDKPSPPHQLRLVVILTRHGVRSPTSSMMGYSWRDWPDLKRDWQAECCGDLTPRGEELVFLMGAHYRSYYGGRLLPAWGCVAQQVYIWADNEERTITTANALAQGLSGGLPGCTVAVNSLPYQTQPCGSPIVGLREYCQRPSSPQIDLWFHPLPALWPKVSPQESNELQAAANDINSRYPQLFAKYKPALQSLQNVLGCCSNSICQHAPPCTLLNLPATAAPGQGSGRALNWPGPFNVGSTASEVFLLEYANSMPCGIVGWGKVRFAGADCRGPGESFRQMEQIHTVDFQEVHQKFIAARIEGSNLANQILQAFQQEVQSPGKSPTKLIIFSGHDTNIANIAGLLELTWMLPDLPDNDTPPGGALVFELSTDPSGEYFMNIHYVHQTLTQLRTGVILSPANPPNWVALPLSGCGFNMYCRFASFQKIMNAAIDQNLVTQKPSD